MNPPTPKPPSAEHAVTAASGWPMLVLNLALLAGGAAVFIASLILAATEDELWAWGLLPGGLLEVAAIVMLCGHFTLQPNESRVLILFGEYRGTVRASGFFWANPFYARTRGRVERVGSPTAVHTAQGGTVLQFPWRRLPTKISLRAHNFNSEKLKVNDKRGNPIEIGAVVVWRVEETARAAFDVEDYESYVQIQSEAALRAIANLYPYDHGELHELSLRDSTEEVSRALTQELQTRLERAGVVVEESRLTHLAYAPEIAQAMLRRQQAEAVIAARQKIVHGAVSMVDLALRELSEKHVVTLDEERKAAMVSNLLVVLCGESEVSPVVNTGTLYT
jgi:regulator of protease activity HflC (stomatin/prohibitin superfamily)